MFTALSLALLASVVRGAVTPTGPGPNDSYNVGAACPIVYDLDTTGTWTNVTIDLMTGSNLGMVLVANVLTGLDGTTGSGSLSWECPAVTPTSTIYFYQFTNNGIDPTWTTRFTIASAAGVVSIPTNATQPDGAAIPWGTGRLVGAASSGTVSTNTLLISTAADLTTTALPTLSTAAGTTTAATTTAAATTAASTTRTSAAAATTTAANSGVDRVVAGGAALFFGAVVALVV